MKKINLVSVCLVLCATVQAVVPATTAPKTATPIAPSIAAPTKDASSDLFYQLLLGELNAREGEVNTGYALILDAARRSNDPKLYRRAADIALQARAGDAALQAARAWIEAQAQDQDAQRYLLQILIALNRVNETIEPLRTNLSLLPAKDRPAALLTVPRGYARVNDKKLAAQVVEQALSGYLTDFQDRDSAATAWTVVGRMRLAAGDQMAALQALQRSQAVSPHTEAAAVLALDLMNLKLPLAEVAFQKYLNGNPKALPELRMNYARALVDGQRYGQAMEQLKVVTQEKPDFAEGWLVLGALLLQDNQLSDAKMVFMRFVELAQKQEQMPQFGRSLIQTYLSLAQIADKQKDFVTAEKWLSKIENSTQLLQAQARRASMLAQQGKLDEARLLITRVPGSTPKDARIKLLAELDLLREFKQYNAAYELLAKATTQFPTDVDLLYDQAMMADKLNLLADMESLLRKIIQIKPDYAHAYNALGYSFAQRNIRLPEAKELIQKALAYTPGDPFIQDSLGWIEFLLNNPGQALGILQLAYKTKADAEIAAHLGEVLWSLGRHQEAISTWREGIALNPNNAVLLETLKRLGVRL